MVVEVPFMILLGAMSCLVDVFKYWRRQREKKNSERNRGNAD